MLEGISICIPVGPYSWYKKYLGECLESVRQQILRPAGVTIIDDMAGLTVEDIKPLTSASDEICQVTDGLLVIRGSHHEMVIKIWRSPWLLGIPACANVGIALGMTDLVFQLSCDDKLLPNCIEEIHKEWERRRDPLGFYWVDVLYSTGEGQALPCGHAMTPKSLWRHTGGYPPQSAVGACDHIFMNWALQHPDDIHLYEVPGGPLYWHREHDEQYTKHQAVYPGTIADVRENFNKLWGPPNWGRYEP